MHTYNKGKQQASYLPLLGHLVITKLSPRRAWYISSAVGSSSHSAILTCVGLQQATTLGPL